MPQALDDNITGPAGVVLYTRPAPSLVPAWAKNRQINEWFPIAGTANSGTQLDNYCGWTSRLNDNGDIYVAASSGHDVNDNSVASINLLVDAPSWRQRTAASPTKRYNAAYNEDGKPAGRHTYDSNIWVPELQRLMMFGARFVWGSGPPELYMTDGWNPVTDTWDRGETYNGGPPGNNSSYNNDGTYGRIPPGYWGAAIDGDGNVWSQYGTRKWIAATRQWTDPFGFSAPPPDAPRGPWCSDSTRGQMFGLCYSNNEGWPEDVIRCVRHNKDGTGRQAITINPSEARTQFMADKPAYAGLVHDKQGDRYLFFDGRGAAVGRVYVITPSAGTSYDMSILPTTGSIPAVVQGGVNSRCNYIDALKMLVAMPSDAAGIYGLRLG